MNSVCERMPILRVTRRGCNGRSACPRLLTLPTSAYRGNTPSTRRANCLHSISPNCVPFSAFKSLKPNRVPAATQEILLNLRFLRGPLINTIRNQEPKFPPLYAANNFSVLPGVIPCNGPCTETYGCNCTNIEVIKYGEQVRLFIENPWYKVMLLRFQCVHRRLCLTCGISIHSSPPSIQSTCMATASQSLPKDGIPTSPPFPIRQLPEARTTH